MHVLQCNDDASLCPLTLSAPLSSWCPIRKWGHLHGAQGPQCSCVMVRVSHHTSVEANKYHHKMTSWCAILRVCAGGHREVHLLTLPSETWPMSTKSIVDANGFVAQVTRFIHGDILLQLVGPPKVCGCCRRTMSVITRTCLQALTCHHLVTNAVGAHNSVSMGCNMQHAERFLTGRVSGVPTCIPNHMFVYDRYIRCKHQLSPRKICCAAACCGRLRQAAACFKLQVGVT